MQSSGMGIELTGEREETFRVKRLMDGQDGAFIGPPSREYEQPDDDVQDGMTGQPELDWRR